MTLFINVMTSEVLRGHHTTETQIHTCSIRNHFTNKANVTQPNKRWWTYANEHLRKGSSGVLWNVDWRNDPVSLLPLQNPGARVLTWRKPDDNCLCPDVLLSSCHVITCHFLLNEKAGDAWMNNVRRSVGKSV